MKRASAIRVLAPALLLAGWTLGCAAGAQALTDTLVSVKLDNGHEQRGVLTMAAGDTPSALVLLFPGTPSVLKPQIVDGKLVKSSVGGNPLVRARQLLARPGLATVLVDCRSDQPDLCAEDYIMSKARFDDARALLARLRQDLPGLKKVWVVGHSLGSLASANLARHGAGVFDGAIHTASILSSRASYRSLVGFDFSAARVPQLFIHHRDDPCPGTPFHEARSAARRYQVPLVALSESAGTRGPPCGAFSEHGFAGAEAALMETIRKAVDRGVAKFATDNQR